MQPRAVRVNVTNIDARFGKSIVELLNLSVTGALLATNTAVPVGSEWALQLRAEGERLPLTARVVRVVRKTDTPDAPHTAEDVWLAGVAFVGLSLETQKAVRRLIAMGRSVDAASTRI